MRLSEAILLGATRYKLDPSGWTCDDGGCLLSIAAMAVGSDWTQIETLWPWLIKKISVPVFTKELPVRDGYFNYYLGPNAWGGEVKPFHFIQALALSAKAGDISIEKIAEWVASIEPNEDGKELTEALCETAKVVYA